MPEYQQRVHTERQELSDKLTRLEAFLGNRPAGLAQDDFELLVEQRDTMQEYLEILDKRIARFS